MAAYHAALLGHGVTAYVEELCWDDYRFAMVQGPLVAVFGYAYGTRTDRGDRMFAAMVRRVLCRDPRPRHAHPRAGVVDRARSSPAAISACRSTQ